jgi:NAD+ synthase (glutamine-hydrolysing)
MVVVPLGKIVKDRRNSSIFSSKELVVDQLVPRVALAQLNPIIGDLEGNFHKIRQAIHQARAQSAQIVLTPEMAMSGYPPEDFILQPHFVSSCEAFCSKLREDTQGLLVVVGTLRHDEQTQLIYNSAAIFRDGVLIGYADKILLPTYDVFDEARYFTSGALPHLIEWNGQRIGVTICEDIWKHAGRTQTQYARDPVEELAALGPDLVLNLSASPYELGKASIRSEVIAQAARTLDCPVAYCNQVGAQDMLIYDGRSQIIDQQGRILVEGPAFEPAVVVGGPESAPAMVAPSTLGEELHAALVLGIRDYFHKQSISRAYLGISGGIDSAVVLALAVDALGKENVHAVFMPSAVTGELSVHCVEKLLSKIQCPKRDLPIEGILQTFERVLGAPTLGITRENLQARIRGTLLMALANESGGIVLATGNKSELAMGYCTLYGDMAGGLAVLADVPKVLVYELARAINRDGERIPQEIIDRPPTAELRPGQLDSDSLPPYAVIDTVVGDYLERNQSVGQIASIHGLNVSVVADIIGRLHRNEFKRRQAPPGLRVTSKAFQVGRKFPIVQRFVI